MYLRVSRTQTTASATLSLADSVQAVQGSVLLIQTEEGSGTGFYVTESGEVIPAYHVVLLPDGTPAKKIQIAIAPPAFQAKGLIITGNTISVGAAIKAVGSAHDLALLKVGRDPFLRHTTLVNGKNIDLERHPASLCPRTFKLRSGDSVFTIGHPLGDLRLVTIHGLVAPDDGVLTATDGVLNGTYLVDMLINHGDSGGPVFSPGGNCVIGVVDSI